MVTVVLLMGISYRNCEKNISVFFNRFMVDIDFLYKVVYDVLHLSEPFARGCLRAFPEKP